LNVGAYAYPFFLTIPAGVPNSMAISNGSSHAHIAFAATAVLQPGKGTKIDHSCPFNVFSVPSGQPHCPLYMEPCFHQVRTCFCVERGGLLIGAAAPNAVLNPEDKFKMKYVVHNQSTVDVKSVIVQLVEIVRWSARGHRESCSSDLFVATLSATQENNQTGLALNDLAKLENVEKKKKDEPVDMTPLLNKCSLILAGDAAGTMVYVPPSARTSIQGLLLSVTHVLKLTVKTNMGTSNPEISYPVVIVNRAFNSNTYELPALPQAQGVPQAEMVPQQFPPGWSPVSAVAVGVPSLQLMAQVEVACDDNGVQQGGSDAMASAPPAPEPAKLNFPGMPFGQLQQLLKSSFDPCTVLTEWCKANPGQTDQLRPESYMQLFLSLSNFNQAEGAEILAKYAEKIDCAQIAGAVQGCEEGNKAHVVRQLATHNIVTDKQNASYLHQHMTEFQFMLVEPLFREGAATADNAGVHHAY
jgi:hypothetical protein